jgi:tRNA(fMet)-specific endonuclease VapC
MATGELMLDTSVVVRHLRSSDPRLLQSGRNLFLPLIALAELHYGAQRSRDPAKVLQQVQGFLAMAAVLLPDERTAEIYGKIHAELSQAGTPIPQNDIWIAALAREYQMDLATTDPHFRRVQGINVLMW